MLFCRHYLSPLNTFMREGKDPDPYPYLSLMDPDLGGPKTCVSGCGDPYPVGFRTFQACCGSGIQCFFDPWVWNFPTVLRIDTWIQDPDMLFCYRIAGSNPYLGKEIVSQKYLKLNLCKLTDNFFCICSKKNLWPPSGWAC
jgi:hypothetical protein